MLINLAAHPPCFRMLIAAGAKVADQWKGQLRVVSSAGERLILKVDSLV